DEYNEVKIVGIEGVVESIRVSPGDKVEAGDTLFRTTASGGSARLQMLLLKRAEYEETLQTLFRLSSSAPSKGMLYAVSSGRIGNLNKDLLLSPDEEKSGALPADLVASALPIKEEGWLGDAFMGAGGSNWSSNIQFEEEPSDTVFPDASLLELFTMLSTGDYTGYAGIVSKGGASPMVLLNPAGLALNDPSALASLGNLPSGQVPSSELFTKAVQIPADMPVMVLENAQISRGELSDAKEGDYLVLLEENPSGRYVLMLLVKAPAEPQTPAEGEDSSSQTPQIPDISSLPGLPEGIDISQLTPEQLSQLSQLTPEQLLALAQLLNPSGGSESAPSQAGETTPGAPDLAGLPEGMDLSQFTPEQLAQLSQLMNAYGAAGSVPDLSGYSIPDLSAYAGMLSGLDFSGMDLSGMDASQEEADQTYQIQDQPLLTITPLNWMQLDIQIDEQDVALVAPGQRVEVIIEALKNTWDESAEPETQPEDSLDRIRTFEGMVRSISTKGTNNGGSSKYTVSIAVPHTEEMLAGMNASVKLVTNSLDNLLLVPIEALEDAGGTLVVYTAYDQKTDTLLSPVPVEIGVSDASYVQITSGLEEGMPYFYREIVPEETAEEP
ncbi:MAG: hypothetical protein J6P72_00820, partial [Firmicutes bacterium]|nr:hypothetical protein [Bacillota bacterium]